LTIVAEAPFVVTEEDSAEISGWGVHGEHLGLNTEGIRLIRRYLPGF